MQFPAIQPKGGKLVQTTPLAINYLEQVIGLATETLSYITEESDATNKLISTLISQGYRNESLVHYHAQRMVRSEHFVNTMHHSQQVLKELQ